MDPLSILGIAAAAIQFIDFGSKLLIATKYYHVNSRKGNSDFDSEKELDGLAQRSDALLLLAQKIETSYVYVYPRVQEQDDYDPTNTNTNTRNDPDNPLLGLCNKCKQVNEEIQALIRKVREADSGESSPTTHDQGLKGKGMFQVWKARSDSAEVKLVKKEISRMTVTLNTIRQDIMASVQISLWYVRVHPNVA